MAFHHDTKSEKVLMREQMSKEGVSSNRRFKSRENGIEALSKTALNSDLFEVCETSSLGYFTL